MSENNPASLNDFHGTRQFEDLNPEERFDALAASIVGDNSITDMSPQTVSELIGEVPNATETEIASMVAELLGRRRELEMAGEVEARDAVYARLDVDPRSVNDHWADYIWSALGLDRPE